MDMDIHIHIKNENNNNGWKIPIITDMMWMFNVSIGLQFDLCMRKVLNVMINCYDYLWVLFMDVYKYPHDK